MSKSSLPELCPPHKTLVKFLNDDLDASESRQIESHVEGCVRCQRALESLTPSTLLASARTFGATFTPHEDFLAELRAGISAELEDEGDDSEPPVLPGYQIVRQLGRGGMGVVYLARDLKLGRLVALKLLHGVAGNETLRTRLKREAEAVARLHHPNAIQIFEIGEATGRPFLVLEFVDGPSLDKAFADGPPSAHRAAELVEKLARAMHAAHQAGIIHRDLKPANVLLASDGTPKITDFGLAKLLDSDADGATRSGQLLGTPSYAAPEQVASLATGVHEVGPTADVYSLGAILYELLTGRPPFRANQPLETLMQVLHQEPTPPSKFNSQVPRDLETICLFCLNKTPVRRYPTADALASDLRRYLEGRPVKARPVRLFGRAVRWSRRHPAVAALIAVVFCSLLGGAGAFAWLWQQAELRAHAQEQARNAAEKIAEAETNARTAAEKQTQVETEARQTADRRAAEAKVDHALSLCSQGSVAPGLLNLADAAVLLPPATDAARVARINLDAWKPYAARYRRDLPHPDEVTGVAYSPDGKAIVTACKDGVVRFWDSVTGSALPMELRHPTEVFVLEFCPDGKAIVTASRDGDVRLWEFPSGKLIGEPMHHDALTVLAVDPDGRYLATGGEDGQIRIWNVETASLYTGPHDQQCKVRSLAFSPQGSVLLAGVDDGTPRIWHPVTEETVAMKIRQSGPITHAVIGLRGISAVGGPWGSITEFIIPGSNPPRMAGVKHDDPIAAFLFDPKGRYFVRAVAGNARIFPRVDLHRVDGMLVTTQVLSTETDVRGLVVSPDGQYLLVKLVGRPPVMWTALMDRPLKVTFDETADGAVVFSPDVRHVVTSGRARGKMGWAATVWEIPASAEGTVTFSEPGVNFLSTGPNDQVLLASGKNVQLWSPSSAKSAAEKWTAPAPVVACSWKAQPAPIAWAVDGAKVHALDARTGKAVRAPQEFAEVVRVFAASCDGKKIAVASGTGCQLLDLETSKSRMLATGDERLTSLTLSPDGTILATGGVSGLVRLWNVADAKMIGEPLACPTGVKKLVFNPSATRLAVGCDDNAVIVWELSTRKRIGTPLVHSSAIIELMWSPDGSLLVTAHGQGITRFWDALTGKQIGPQTARNVIAIAFTNDGKLLLTGDRNQAVRSWRVPQVVTTPAAELPARISEELGIKTRP